MEIKTRRVQSQDSSILFVQQPLANILGGGLTGKSGSSIIQYSPRIVHFSEKSFVVVKARKGFFIPHIYVIDCIISKEIN